MCLRRKTLTSWMPACTCRTRVRLSPSFPAPAPPATRLPSAGTKKKAEPLVKSAPSLHTAGSGPSAKPAAHKPPLASQSPPGSLPTKLNLQSVLPPPPAGGGRSPIAGSSAGSTVVSKVLAGGLSEFADDEDDDSDDLDRDLRAGRVGGATPRSASAPPLGVSRSSRMAAMDDDDDDDF